MKVVMENCQVWPYFELYLRPKKIMLPVAENDEGKSVWLKVLRCALLGKYDGPHTYSNIIRMDSHFAKFSLTFDDGRIWKVLITSKDVRHSLYDRENTKARIYYHTNGHAPEEVLNFLGVYIVPELNYVSWIIDPDDMLVGVKTTPSENFKIFSPILRPKHLLQERQNLKDSLDEVSRLIQITKKVIANTESLVNKTPYVNVDEVEIRLNKNLSKKEEVDNYLAPLHLVTLYMDCVNELSNFCATELELLATSSSCMGDITQLQTLSNFSSEEIVLLTDICRSLELKTEIATLPNSYVLLELNICKLISETLIPMHDLSTLSNCCTEELGILTLIPRLLEARDEMSSLSSLDINEIDMLMKTATCVEVSRELASLPKHDVDNLETLTLLTSVLQSRQELKLLSELDELEISLLSQCIPVVDIKAKLEELSVGNSNELDLLTKILDVLRIKTAIIAYTKNVKIAEQRLSNMQVMLDNLRAELDEESKLSICPKCGYDVRDDVSGDTCINKEVC